MRNAILWNPWPCNAALKWNAWWNICMYLIAAKLRESQEMNDEQKFWKSCMFVLYLIAANWENLKRWMINKSYENDESLLKNPNPFNSAIHMIWSQINPRGECVGGAETGEINERYFAKGMYVTTHIFLSPAMFTRWEANSKAQSTYRFDTRILCKELSLKMETLLDRPFTSKAQYTYWLDTRRYFARN